MALLQPDRSPPEEFGRYVRGEVLGQGSFATTYECHCEEDPSAVFAVKVTDMASLCFSGAEERNLKRLKRETQILMNMKGKSHTNVVQLIEAFDCQVTNWYYFVLELVPGGNNMLKCMVKRPDRDPFTEDEVVCISKQIVAGLKHLHNEDIIHRDLKLENVLVVKQGCYTKPTAWKVKLADFGLSKQVKEDMSKAVSKVGSPKYMAPELQPDFIKQHDCRVDLWSFGVLLFILLVSRFPFYANSAAAEKTQAEIIFEVHNVRFKVIVKDPETARSVLLQLLRIEADERLSIEELENHSWFGSSTSSTATEAPAQKRRRGGDASGPNDMIIIDLSEDAHAPAASAATASIAEPGVTQGTAEAAAATPRPSQIPGEGISQNWAADHNTHAFCATCWLEWKVPEPRNGVCPYCGRVVTDGQLPAWGTAKSGKGRKKGELPGSDEDWGQRIKKRLEGLDAMRRSDAYIRNLSLKRGVRPQTPDPYDHCLSKRDWEKALGGCRAFHRNVHTLEVMGYDKARAASAYKQAVAIYDRPSGCSRHDEKVLEQVWNKAIEILGPIG